MNVSVCVPVCLTTHKMGRRGVERQMGSLQPSHTSDVKNGWNLNQSPSRAAVALTAPPSCNSLDDDDGSGDNKKRKKLRLDEIQHLIDFSFSR